MFFGKDKNQKLISDVFGKNMGMFYKDSKDEGSYFAAGLLIAVNMVKAYPEASNLMKEILLEEIENLSTAVKDSKTFLILLNSASIAYAHWAMTSTPILTRLERLKYVSPGWRMDALSGVQYWMSSIMNRPAPVRAWLVDLYCTSAALAWDATVEIESEFTYSVPALPYAFQALAINGLIHGIKLEKQTMPLYLEEALELALGGYANGFPQNLWGNII